MHISINNKLEKQKKNDRLHHVEKNKNKINRNLNIWRLKCNTFFNGKNQIISNMILHVSNVVTLVAKINQDSLSMEF